jgi:hypothetical protein
VRCKFCPRIKILKAAAVKFGRLEKIKQRGSVGF